MVNPKEALIIEVLAEWMAEKLEKNRHKGNRWRTTSTTTLLTDLLHEVWELETAMRTGSTEDVAKECADVANFTAMILDAYLHPPKKRL